MGREVGQCSVDTGDDSCMLIGFQRRAVRSKVSVTSAAQLKHMRFNFGMVNIGDISGCLGWL